MDAGNDAAAVQGADPGGLGEAARKEAGFGVCPEGGGVADGSGRGCAGTSKRSPKG